MNEEKEQLLKKLRVAVFYQVELWDAALTIGEILNNPLEGEWDALARLDHVRGVFGERILAESDLDVFLTETDGPPLDVDLDGETRTALRQKLAKGSLDSKSALECVWTHRGKPR